MAPSQKSIPMQISIKQKDRGDQYYGTFSVQKNALDKERLDVMQKLFFMNENGVASEVAIPAAGQGRYLFRLPWRRQSHFQWF